MTAAINWYGEITAWTSYLRTQGICLTIGDELRISTLAERLKAERIEIDSAESAALWFAPVTCRSADEQNRLVGFLTTWAGMRLDAKPTVAPVSPVVVPLLRETRLAAETERPDWHWLVAVGVMALALGTVFVLLVTHILFQLPAPVIETLTPKQGTWPGASNRLMAGLVVLVPFVLVLFLRYARKVRRAAALRGLVPRDAPTGALNIKVDTLSLFRPEAVRGGIADLRRFRLMPAEWIDGPRSVAATVAAAGRVRLVQGLRSMRPEHLLLVDLAGADDILAVVAELIVARLREADVAVERFDYQGDPRRLRHIGKDGRVVDHIELDALHTLCPDHRLIVLSDAASFSEAGSERMRSWVEDLCDWSDRAVLTPLPAWQWGPRERALIRLGFNIATATPGGIGDLAQQFRVDLPQERATPGAALPPRFDRLMFASPYRWLGDRSPEPADIALLISELRVVLGRDGFLYLAALAVFPAIHVKLTLALGRVLNDLGGYSTLTEETLSLLCRVPWLRRGRLPNWLRLALVRDLRNRSDEAETVRIAWATLLEPSPEGEPTALPIDVVRQVEPGLPQLVGGLLKRSGPYREAILIAFLNHEELPELAVELPQRMTQMLRRRVAWADVTLGVAGLATGVLLASFLQTVGETTTALEQLFLSPQQIARLENGLRLARSAMALLQGISPWPTILLRVFGAGLTFWLICYALRSLQDNKTQIDNELRLGKSSPSLHREWEKIRSQPYLYPTRTAQILALIWFHRVPPGSAERPRVRFDELVGGFAVSWPARCLRAAIGTCAMLALWPILPRIFGAPYVPPLGPPMREIYWLVTTMEAVLTLFLIFVVADAALLSRAFIKKLTVIQTEWPTQTIRFNLAGADLADWLDMHCLATRTRCITRLVYLPFIALAVFIPRSSLLDHFTTNWTLLIFQALSAAVVIGSFISLRAAAEQARAVARDRMTATIIAARAYAAGQDRAAELEKVLAEIDGLNDGAFAPWSSQPLVKAVLLPLLTYGGTMLLHFYALPGD